jgi:tripartite-type tricarboxylate transporter receptor subunit TctC
MKLPRRKFLHLTAGAAALAAISRTASALDYPTRPVRLIVGFQPGGLVEVAARLIASQLTERLGQRFFVENRPGASSNIATSAVVRAAPDGYTLLVASNAVTYNATLYDNLDFNFIRDIAPVAPYVRGPFIMTVNPSLPAKTIPEFIAYAKANPGKINMATAGSGSAAALYGELFKRMAGVELFPVHYRGAGPAVLDLMSGRVEIIFIPVAAVIGHIRSGQLRALGVTTMKRIDLLPNLPTINEFLPGYEAIAWGGVGAPVNTPREIIAILNTQVNAALGDASLKARLADLGAEPFASSPTEFGKFIVDETEKWAKVIRTAGIKAE